MSKRHVTRIRVEVTLTLPPGKSQKWGLEWAKAALEHRVRAASEADPRPSTILCRLAGREVTYLT